MSEISAAQLLSQLRSTAAMAGGEARIEKPPGDPVEFSKVLLQAIDEVNTSQQESGALKRAFETGEEGIGISQVMVASQKANVEFQMMVQVRNKLVTAYQEIMNMQI